MHLTDWGSGLVAIGGTFAGLLVGYLLGYRAGRVSGELHALKATMSYYRGRRRSTVEEPNAPAEEALRT